MKVRKHTYWTLLTGVRVTALTIVVENRVA